jgi:hypothetical protein
MTSELGFFIARKEALMSKDDMTSPPSSTAEQRSKQSSLHSPNTYAEMKGVQHVSNILVGQNVGQKCETGKSSTQVALTVRPRVVRPEACGLKPGRKRPYRLMGRYSKEERDSVVTRAAESCLSVNEFMRLSTLEANHIPPMNPELRKRFMSVHKELCRQGNDLNRIAAQMETNALSSNEHNTMLGMIGWSLVAAHKAVGEAMTYGLEMPDD